MKKNEEIIKMNREFTTFIKEMKKSGVTNEHIQMCIEDMQKYAIEQMNKQLLGIFEDIKVRMDEMKKCLNEEDNDK